MSVLRPLLTRRGRVVLVAASLLLIATLVAAPSVGGAKPASVKQFIASLSGAGTDSLTVTVTNCGGPVPLPDDCTASSTIAVGAVQIKVPTGIQAGTSVSARTPSGTIWNASVAPCGSADPASCVTINVLAPGGTNKLNPGQSLLVTFNVPTACPGGTTEFTTKAWGSNSISGTDPFEIKSSQPRLTCATSLDGQQTETITGDFQGTLNVSITGEPYDFNCSSDPTFGGQWDDFHLPNQVNIIPNPDFVPGNDPKIATSRFQYEGFDSSLYLICYASPTTFSTRGGTAPEVVNIGGTNFFVGILPNCYDPVSGSTRPEPCTSEQFLDLATNEIVISTRIPPGDPFKR
jgi:hypothetical protein